jgi:hypothetical protein
MMHAGEGIAYRLLGRDHRHYVELHAPLYVVDREHIRRVGHGHEKLAVQPRNRDQLVRLCHVARHQRHDFLRHPQFRQIDQRRIEAAPHAHRHVLVGDELFVRQDLEQPAAFLLLMVDRFLELARQKETVLDEDIGDAFCERFASHLVARLGPAFEPVNIL